MESARWPEKVNKIKTNLMVVQCALKHPKTPWYCKAIIGLVVAYALSPIDLIPDFIPVLGMLDDLLIVPLGLMLAIRLIPTKILEECRQKISENSL